MKGDSILEFYLSIGIISREEFNFLQKIFNSKEE